MRPRRGALHVGPPLDPGRADRMAEVPRVPGIDNREAEREGVFTGAARLLGSQRAACAVVMELLERKKQAREKGGGAGIEY